MTETRTVKLTKRYDHKSKEGAELFIQAIEAACTGTPDELDHYLDTGDLAPSVKRKIRTELFKEAEMELKLMVPTTELFERPATRGGEDAPAQAPLAPPPPPRPPPLLRGSPAPPATEARSNQT